MNLNRERLEILGRRAANMSIEYNRDHFDMSAYFRHNNSPTPLSQIPKVVEEHFCGTVACLAGHVPIVFPNEFKEWLQSKNPSVGMDMFDWPRLVCDMLGIGLDPIDETKIPMYYYLFAGSYAIADDPFYRTSWAAADRIAYVLEGKYTGEAALWFEESDAADGASARAGWVSQRLYDERRMALKVFA